jgi:hypothetical protein
MRYVLKKGDVLVCPSTGKHSVVAWADTDHTQFEGGNSCSTRDLPSFYGERQLEKLILSGIR